MYKITETMKIINRTEAKLKAVTFWTIAFCSCLSVFSLFAILLKINIIDNINSGHILMSNASALCFLIINTALFVYILQPQSLLARNFSKAFTFVVLIFVTIILMEYLTSMQSDIEHIMLGIPVESGPVPLKHMSYISAVNFFLASISLLLMITWPAEKSMRRSVSSGIATFIFSVGTVSMLGYLYKTPFLYGGKIKPIAFPSSVAFILLGIALITSAGPDLWPIRLLIGSSVRARLMRTFLPITVIVILLHDMLDLFITAEMSNPTFIMSVLAILSIITVGIIVSRLAQSIGGEIDRATIERKKAEDEREKVIIELRDTLGKLNKAKEELEQKANELARSNAELERFAFAAAHDLKEPVIVIESFIRRLQRLYGEKLDDKGNELLIYAIDGTTRMQELISDLLAYARIGSKESDLKPVDSEDIIKHAISNLQISIEKSGAVITHDIQPTVTADQIQLVQLFQNLIGNAIKFCADSSPHIHISAEQKENEWLFSVSDNGIGIAPEDANRIFEIFQRLHSTSKYPGTGIGLAICKKIAERHGGRIWVEGEMGKGSTFYFTIPDKKE